jgi:hypothetical protein
VNGAGSTNISLQVWLVFRSGHHYVFINGEARDLLTVTLSAAALSLFEQYDVTAEDVAKSAAEWASPSRRGPAWWTSARPSPTTFQNSAGTILEMNHAAAAPAERHLLSIARTVNPTSPSS